MVDMQGKWASSTACSSIEPIFSVDVQKLVCRNVWNRNLTGHHKTSHEPSGTTTTTKIAPSPKEAHMPNIPIVKSSEHMNVIFKGVFL